MDKALRKEMRADKWEKAISNLSTYATCAQGPVSYVNEKEAENAVTILRSLPRGHLVGSWAGEFVSSRICKFVEGSLLKKTDSYHLYQVHGMVSQYLNGKINESLQILLADSTPEGIALMSPWLLIFGKETTQKFTGERIEFFLCVLEEKLAVITSDAISQAHTAIISISDLEASRASFSSILGSKITKHISMGSKDLITASATVITSIFTKGDYCDYFPFLDTIGAVDKLASILENCHDPMIQTNVSTSLAKLAEFGSPSTVDKVLHSIPMNRLSVGSEISQNHAIITSKAFYELGSATENGSLQPGTLNFLPWQARLSLEKFVLSDRNVSFWPNGGPQIRDMILESLLIKPTLGAPTTGNPDNTMRSESAFLLMKLACSGGEPCVRKFLDYNIILDLVKMMQCNISDLQDSAYTALHQMLFGHGGIPILNRILQMGLVEKLVHSIDSQSEKTREVNVHCVLDVVELGNKACLERLLFFATGGEACKG
ncbi:hypothetical protein Acr_11g0012890 [Actinidia rufa]|uniref:ARM repeat superfamily protein n=1 Tax=Actinidia rufa TaxID=165716 RepID=A0A7J0FEF1_9ERIC|nr:hypothetical protein Acr_11g0012890 [Actinidia rufa]